MSYYWVYAVEILRLMICYNWESFLEVLLPQRSLNTVRGQRNKASVASWILTSVYSLLYLGVCSGAKEGGSKI